MFIGHFAVAFAAKRVTPGVSLAALIGAAQLADLLWPPLVALGVEQFRIEPGGNPFLTLNFTSYPYSHSLLLAVWGIIFAWFVRMVGGDGRVRAVIVRPGRQSLGTDFVTHRPDMPLYPGGPRLGLGLWNSVPATVAVEVPLFVAGLWIYARTTRARDAIGRWAFWGFAAFLGIGYVGNMFGPPPTSVNSISIAVFVVGAILLLWSWWFDRHREATKRGGI